MTRNQCLVTDTKWWFVHTALSTRFISPIPFFPSSLSPTPPFRRLLRTLDCVHSQFISPCQTPFQVKHELSREYKAVDCPITTKNDVPYSGTMPGTSVNTALMVKRVSYPTKMSIWNKWQQQRQVWWTRLQQLEMIKFHLNNSCYICYHIIWGN